ncbi:hypothetical protein FB45DRAFT_930758 [Roridomyces roridus]|uniref:Uncharacterized protein n=1 Tax=Roridomyces roridus TaxID=1738132 RepID=A0AAD7FGR6_9AGAR|nr:hypothetical protein FB45DRAFT_930758 [Roridomyces roridus]
MASLTEFQLPPHPSCFGDPTNTSSICQAPSAAMIDFLNITTANVYLEFYCNNPPSDSCAFGFCPNPDVASPAVRYSTYFTSLVAAILVIYSPEDVISSFFAQLLNVYSLIVAAVVSIMGHNLTKMHSVVALSLAGSPLSLYLVVYVFLSILGKQTRLRTVFGPGMHLNRALVLIVLPLWISLFIFTLLPPSVYQFQQAACDGVIGDHHIHSLFFMPFISFFMVYPHAGAAIIGSLLIMWGIAILLARKSIWGEENERFPFIRIWRTIGQRYPLLHFYSVIVLPSSFWIFDIEVGVAYLSPREKFTPTYGQLLAIFVTIPPFIQLCTLVPGLGRWFADLWWVRLLTCRLTKRYSSKEDPTRAVLLGNKS